MYLLYLNFLDKFELFSGQPEIELSSFFLNLDRMKALKQKKSTLVATVLIVAFALGSAFGQAVKVEAEAPEFDDIPSPQFAGVKNKSFKPLNWLEIEVKLTVAMSPEPASKTLDRLMVKWYVAVKNENKPGTFLLLTKDIEHVNVPLADQVYCSLYLSPASLRRITGTDRGGKGAVEYVGFEVLVNGSKVAEGTSKGKPGWWSTPSPKISRSDAVPLLGKSDTPFRDMWWDRYPETSVDRR